MKNCFLLPALLYSLNLVSQAPNQDTIKSQELDPVVIVGDRAKYIAGSVHQHFKNRETESAQCE